MTQGAVLNESPGESELAERLDIIQAFQVGIGSTSDCDEPCDEKCGLRICDGICPGVVDEIVVGDDVYYRRVNCASRHEKSPPIASIAEEAARELWRSRLEPRNGECPHFCEDKNCATICRDNKCPGEPTQQCVTLMACDDSIRGQMYRSAQRSWWD